MAGDIPGLFIGGRWLPRLPNQFSLGRAEDEVDYLAMIG
jgi:hypothetical protein